MLIVFDNIPGPAGPTGETGPAGPAGETGPSGPAGETATVTVGTTTSVQYDQPPTVTNSGDQYNAVLDFEIPEALPSAVIIPYAANSDITLITNSSGVLTRTNLLGFGYSSSNINVDSGSSFDLDLNAEFLVFTMPYDGIITTVAGQYSTVALWRAPSNMSLYIAVAIAAQDSNHFTIEETSKAFAPPYVQGIQYPAREPRSGIAEDLKIKAPKGSRIAVFAGYQNTGGTLGLTLPFNFTGSISIIKDNFPD